MISAVERMLGLFFQPGKSVLVAGLVKQKFGVEANWSIVDASLGEVVEGGK